MGKVTLKDIAAEAKVSVMSVSKAINGKKGISDETRKRILQIASDLNYMPNMVAKNLRNNTTRTIGVILSDSSEMVTSKILRAIQDCCSKRGYSILVANTDCIVQREREAINTLISKQIDGLIFVAPLLNGREDIIALQDTGIPFVFLMRKNDGMGINTVINDNLLGGYQVVEHLLSEGCRRFLFMSIRDSETSKERMKGCYQALENRRIPAADYRTIESMPAIEDAANALTAEIQNGFHYDALVCGCDLQAIGAMDVLLNAGIRIPEDVCLTGYDGIEVAKYLRVGLTTVVQPLYEIGYTGCEILLDRIKFKDLPIQKVVLKSTLETRQSSNRLNQRSGCAETPAS